MHITLARLPQVVKRQGDLLNYIIFLRVTPLLPNTFINVTSPIVGVPLAPFMLGECGSRCLAECRGCAAAGVAAGGGMEGLA